MSIDSTPASLVGRAAAARIAALREQLQWYRREHAETLAALPPVTEDPVSHALAAPSRRILGQVEAALERIADGTYGRCVSCQGTIPARRLAVEPYQLECVACAVPAADRSA